MNGMIDWYMTQTDRPLLADTWIILSEEQFVNAEAADLILEVTERLVEFTRFGSNGGPQHGSNAGLYGGISVGWLLGG